MIVFGEYGVLFEKKASNKKDIVRWLRFVKYNMWNKRRMLYNIELELKALKERIGIDQTDLQLVVKFVLCSPEVKVFYHRDNMELLPFKKRVGSKEAAANWLGDVERKIWDEDIQGGLPDRVYSELKGIKDCHNVDVVDCDLVVKLERYSDIVAVSREKGIDPWKELE